MRPVALVSSSPAYGGAERYLTLLAAELARRGPVVAYVSDLAPPETHAALAGAGAQVRVGRGLAPRGAGGAAGLVRELARLRPRLAHVNLCDQGDGLGAIAAAWPRASRAPRRCTSRLETGRPPTSAWPTWRSGGSRR